MALSKNLYVIIVGCGRLGSFLANRLSHEGHSVVVVDINPGAFDALTADQFSGFQVEGDATELAILQQAKIAQADVVIGATHDENANLMAAQIAKTRFHVPKVLVRIHDPHKAAFCEAIGIDYVCPTRIATEKITQFVRESKSGETGRPV